MGRRRRARRRQRIVRANRRRGARTEAGHRQPRRRRYVNDGGACFHARGDGIARIVAQLRPASLRC